MGANYKRTIEIRCSEPGCNAKTTAPAERPDAKGHFGIGYPADRTWVTPSERGVTEPHELDHVFGTCSKHKAP